MFAERMDRVRALMTSVGVDALLVSVGADLPYLTGYEAMPLERLTMLVVTGDGSPRLVVPRLEAPRVVPRPDVFEIEAWDETDDPIELVAALVDPAGALAIGDQTWARFVVDLADRLPRATFRHASSVMTPLRSVKDATEVDMLRKAAAAADRVAGRLQAGEIPLVGRTEAEVSAELGRQLLDEGHQRVNFAIVAAGANAASPHHHPGPTVIEADQVVLCDFGGTMYGADGVGYCSDITRCVWIGDPPSEFADQYDLLERAQTAGVAAAVVGTAAEAVDAAGRDIISEAGYGEFFIHRTGHGIGVDPHEEPYIVAGNAEPLQAGNAFSIEPGMYFPGTWGMRLEDIVVASPDGPDPLNRADHGLACVG